MFATLACVLFATSPVPANANDTADGVVIQRLVAALNDADPDIRQNLASALAKIGSASIEPLTAALKDANAERRAGAAYALGLHGESAKAAMPNLLDLLNDSSLDVRRQASFALSRIVSAPRGAK